MDQKGVRMKRFEKGFTLIELMSVVAIVGILTTIGIPSYTDYVVRSQAAVGLNLSSKAKTAVTEHYINHSEFPLDNTSAGLETADKIFNKYVDSVAVTGNVITVTYGNDAHPLIVGKTVTLSAAYTDGSVSWTCASGGTIEDKHLPAVCR